MWVLPSFLNWGLFLLDRKLYNLSRLPHNNSKYTNIFNMSKHELINCLPERLVAVVKLAETDFFLYGNFVVTKIDCIVLLCFRCCHSRDIHKGRIWDCAHIHTGMGCGTDCRHTICLFLASVIHTLRIKTLALM